MSLKFKRNTLIAFVLFCIILVALIVSLNVKGNRDSREFLEQSISSELISTASAAREMIDPDLFAKLNSAEEARSNKDYQETLESLRALAENTNAEYIYALKVVDNKFYFIYDTDTENDTLFTEYNPDAGMIAALQGETKVTFGDTDEYGNFNSAAIPLLQDGKIIGIVGADIIDTLFVANQNAAQRNVILLIITLIAVFAVMTIALFMLFKQLQALHDHLEHMAKYDKLTQLPNRQYLMEQLDERTKTPNPQPFALLFVDLDNFKSVNDNAGHDAGDRLLINIAEYLQSHGKVDDTFRPTAGKLNVAARIGGDEFVLISNDVDSVEKADTLASELLNGFNNLHNEVSRYVEKYGVGLSVGVALYPYHSDDYNVIIKYADIAMYHAKNSGKNQYRVYNDEMEQKPEK